MRTNCCAGFLIGAGCQLPLVGSGESIYVPSSYRNGKAAAPVEVSSWGSVLRSGHLSFSAERTKLLNWSTRKCNASMQPPEFLSAWISPFVLHPACISSWETRSVRTPHHLWGPLLPHMSRSFPATCVLLSYRLWVTPGVWVPHTLMTVANSECLQITKGQGKLIEMLPKILLQQSTAEGNWKGSLWMTDLLQCPSGRYHTASCTFLVHTYCLWVSAWLSNTFANVGNHF